MLNEIVYLVEDDSDLNRTLVELLSSVDITCQSFYNGLDFLAAIPLNARGCALLDIRLPGMGGLLLQQELLNCGQHLPIIFITGYSDVEIAVEAMKKGAFDFLKKPFQAEILLEKVQKALYHDNQYNLPNFELKKRFNSLTVKELAILKKIAEGKINKEIANEMKISIKTVEVHRSNIMNKMDAKNVAELIKFCITAGLVPEHNKTNSSGLS